MNRLCRDRRFGVYQMKGIQIILCMHFWITIKWLGSKRLFSIAMFTESFSYLDSIEFW